MKTHFQQKLLLLFFVLLAAGGGVKGQFITVTPIDSTCVRDTIKIQFALFFANPGTATVHYGFHNLPVINFDYQARTITVIADLIPNSAGPDLYINVYDSLGAPIYNGVIPYLIKQKATVQFPQSQYCQGPNASIPPTITNGPVTFSGNLTTNFNSSTGIISLNAPPSTQVLNWTQNGCAFNNGSFTHIIDSIIPSELVYRDTVCQAAVTILTPTSASPSPGTFRAYDALTTSIPATNLVIDSTTGEINVTSSQPGTYSIVYFPLSQCTSPDTQAVTILEQPNPFFAYANDVFCVNDPNPLPDSVTVAGGRFYGGFPGFPQFPAAVVDPFTGEINLAATVAQNSPNQSQYFLHYTADNGCQEDSIITIEILDQSADFVIGSEYCFNATNGAQASQIIHPGYFVVTDPLGARDTIFNNNPRLTSVEVIPLGAADTGTYQVTYYLDPNIAPILVQCRDTFSTTVEVKGAVPPPFVLQEDTACQGQQLISIIGPIQTPMPTFSGDSGLDINSFGDIDPSNTPIGSYEVFMTFVTGTCTTTVTLDTMVIEAPGNAQVAYGSNTFCASSTTNPVPSVNQPGNGTFSSPSPNLTVDPNSGEIFLNLYTPTNSVENHDIVYLPHPDSCANPETVTVQLRTFISAQLAYPDSILCKGASSFVVPQIATPSPGQFSAFQYANPTLPDNNLIINGSTGAIHVDSSMVGPYLIVYTPDGQCSSTETVTISIQEFPNPFFSYAETVFCANEASPLPDSIANPGGYFQGGVPGAPFFPAAVVDSVTGAIDLQATSNLNQPSYFLHYIANNGCEEDSILEIKIRDLSAAFTINSQYCFNEQGWATATQVSQRGYFIVIDPNGVRDTIFNSLPNLPNVDLVQLVSALPGVYQLGYFLDTLCIDSFWTTIDVIGVVHPPYTLDTNAACQQVTSVIVNGPTQNPPPLFSGDGILAIANNGTINPSATPAGTYAVYMTTYASCTARTVIDSFEVVEAANSQIAYGNNVFCTNDTVNPLPSLVSPLGGSFSCSSPLLTVDAGTGEIFLDQYTPTSNIESHTIFYTPHQDSCNNQVQINIQLRTYLPSNLQYQDTILCKGSFPFVTPLVRTPSPGQFSVYQYGNPSLPDNNLIVDSSTGVIDVNTSLLGDYLLEYAPDDQCSSPDTLTITIDDFTDPFFSYAEDTFCVNDAFPFPNSITTPGGSFFGGVPNNNFFSGAIVDPVSGVIDLPATSAQNVAAPYYVTYTAGNGCTTTHIVEINISDLNSEFVIDSQVCFNAQGWLEASQVSEPGFFVVIDPNGLRDTIFNTAIPTPSIVDVIQVNNAVPGTYQVGYFHDTSSIFVLCQDSFWTSVNVLGVAHPPIVLDTNVVCKQTSSMNISVPTASSSQVSFSSNGPTGLITPAGAITPPLAPSGTYAIYMTTTIGGCTSTILLDSLEILEPVNAQVEYGGNILCKSNTVNPVPSFYQPLGGTFSSPTLQQFIDPQSGEIFLDQYIPAQSVETHAIFYNPDPDSCGSGTQVNVQIRTFSASFSYPDDTVCQAIPFMNYSPSSTFGNGGFDVRYTLPQNQTGLSLDVNTGTIRPDLSLPGTYNVLYVIDDSVCVDTFYSGNSVTVTLSPDSTIIYPATHCFLDSNLLPTYIATPGGIFSASPSGLTIDPQTGLINMATSVQGSYNITYNLANTGCPVDDQVQFQILDTLVSYFHYLRDTFCSDHGIAIAIEDNGNGGIYTQVNTGNPILLNPTNGEIQITGSPFGEHIIKRIATSDPCPIPFSDTIWILETDTSQFTYGGQTRFCQTLGSVEIDTNSINVPLGDFSANNGLLINSVTGTIDLANSPPGIHTVIFTPRPGVFCPPQQELEIEIFAYDYNTSISYPSDTVCEGSGLFKPYINGNSSGNFSASGLIWSDPDSGIVDLNLTSPNAPNTVYSITYSLGGVCQEMVTVPLFVHEYDDPSFEYSDSNYCENGIDPAVIESTIATPGGIFTNNNTNTLFLDSITGLIDLDSSGPADYEILYNTNGRCPYFGSVSLAINQAPDELVYRFTPPESRICAGDSVLLEAFTKVEVELLIGTVPVDGFQDNGSTHIDVYEDNESITIIQSTALFDCQDVTKIFLTVKPIPELNIIEYTGNLSSGDPAFILMESDADSTKFNYFSETHGPVEVSPPSGDISWYDALELAQLDLELSSLSGLRPGTATVYVVPEAKGCQGEADSVTFLVNPADVKIFIPEAFTPNGDGWNDTWKVQWTEDLSPEDYTLRVFNRSHGKVAQDIHPIHPNWAGDNLPDGVYWWVLLDRSGNSMRTGGVTIRRQ